MVRYFPAALLLFSTASIADIAKHTTVQTNGAGVPQSITEIVADDRGNLRIENYGVAGGASASSVERGARRDVMIFQSAEQRMLSIEGGTCRAMDTRGASGSGMPAGDMAAYQAQMRDAQDQVAAAMAEMAKQNPEMAKMLEQQMGGPGGIASMMQPPELVVEDTGEARTFGDYDTVGFVVTEVGGTRSRQTVWAADIDAVDGAALVSNAMLGMMSHYRDFMDGMGIGAPGGGIAAAIMEKMEDYYPIVSEDDSGQTRLVSTDGGGSAEFYPVCEPM